MPDHRRILHVMWSLEIGGAERALYQLVREQRRAGYEADVAVGSRGGYYAERAQEAGATAFELAQRSALDPRMARRAQALFRKYDIVHFHSAEPALVAIASYSGTRAFYTHRSGRFDYPAKQALRYRLTGLLLRRFAGLSANSGHALEVAAALFRVPRSRIALTYNGLDFDLLKPTRPVEAIRSELRPSNGAFRVATSGNLRGWKRVDLLIRAMRSVHPDVNCYVIGDGPDRGRLEQLSTELGTTGRVWFLGKKTNVADYLQAMDAFVLPSGNEEAFGNSAVEAMALSLPTIVFSDGGGLLEHIQHGATGFVVSGVNDLAETLNRLEGDRSLGASVGAAGSTFVRENYNLERMLAAYERLYQGIA